MLLDAQTANPTNANTNTKPEDLRLGISQAPRVDSKAEASPASTISTITPLEEVQTLVEVKPGQEKQPIPSGYHTAYTAVRRALEQRTPLLMEVTVGANDYTPALLPALEWLADSM